MIGDVINRSRVRTCVLAFFFSFLLYVLVAHTDTLFLRFFFFFIFLSYCLLCAECVQSVWARRNVRAVSLSNVFALVNSKNKISSRTHTSLRLLSVDMRTKEKTVSPVGDPNRMVMVHCWLFFVMRVPSEPLTRQHLLMCSREKSREIKSPSLLRSYSKSKNGSSARQRRTADRMMHCWRSWPIFQLNLGAPSSCDFIVVKSMSELSF